MSKPGVANAHQRSVNGVACSSTGPMWHNPPIPRAMMICKFHCKRLTVAVMAVILPTVAHAADPIPGPVNARVISVYEGDTLTVDASPWSGVTSR